MAGAPLDTQSRADELLDRDVLAAFCAILLFVVSANLAADPVLRHEVADVPHLLVL